ncbi:NAD-dependent epimerase/dehydratase family protein [Myxococcus sp. CA039A]|uniref:NAD-dependent epimerase/dehydratase family protein n=1 Tax=Myxococcus sp. CA039A TaxID=2741737 RepID=UPI00157B8E34|nr:NAD-dependent epimerase/dehydratase family protein [Myxococcus sp. CA039A]NTX55796.1 NAD-dependent epimerase/dehydratase family protein [Myxococcus sp. CA039A]
MKVLLFGATGMVGQGVLRECLRSPSVEQVLAVGRAETGQRHEKLRELSLKDFLDASSESSLDGYDACFFCLGVSSAGMNEEDYRRVTYDLTLSVAQVLARVNPRMTFIYVSGAGTDSTEKGRSMWARVKGRTENALLAMPFRAVYLFRPGIIRPMHGIVSKTRVYRVLYKVLSPLYPVLKAVAPGFVTTTEAVGLAMVATAELGAPKKVLENDDINNLARLYSQRQASIRAGLTST